MPLIHGKQFRDDSINIVKFISTGATDGYVATYHAGDDGILWQDLGTLGVTSITFGDGISGNTSTGDLTIEADVDDSSIFINGSNQISLGDPSTGDIGFGSSNTYRFVGGANSVIVEGDLTVQGTTTFLDSTNTAISDNIIVINSGATVGFGTAGISVDLGNGSFSDILWHEANGGYWAIDNPDGSGATQTFPILTTASLETGSTAVSIVQGTGTDIDKLTIDVVEENFSNIPNSALQNSSFTVADDNVVTGSTPVSLGGTLNIGLAPDSVKEFHLNATGSLTDGFVLTYDSGTGGFEWLDPSVIAVDTYVTGGTITTTPDNNSESGELTLSYVNDEGGTYTLPFQDIFVTGGTLSGTDLLLTRNDGTTLGAIDFSSLDVNDTFSTGTTNSVSATNDSNTQSTDITGNGGFTDFTVSFTDTFVTGGTLTGNNIVLTNNDSSQVSIDISGSDFNDTYVTGGTASGISDSSNNGLITLTYNNDEGGSYTLDYTDKYVTGGTLSGSDIILTQNDGDTVTIDVSGLDVNDTFATGVTTNSGQIVVSGNDGFTTFTGGTVVETVSGNSPITASTTNGDVTVGLDYSSLQLAVPTTSDKELTVTATTSGDNSDTGIQVTTTPVNDGYIGVSVNGVWYIVGDNDTSKDCYFSSTGAAAGVRAIADIVAGDKLVWNGTTAGFELDSSDNVAFYYNILQ